MTRLLAEHGPMTAREIAAELGVSPEYVRGSLGRAKADKQIHIKAWRRDEDGGRLYPRAIWAAGDGRDAPKPPKLTKLDYNRRHRQRKARAVSSVWQLGRAVDHRRLGALA